jgi:Ca2+-binding EF-hand superfamily protein
MKYYLNKENKINATATELPKGAQEVTFEDGISASDYNNDIDAGGNKYIIDENVVKLRPLTPEEIAEQEAQAIELERQRIQCLFMTKQDLVSALKTINPNFSYALLLDMLKQDDNAFMSWDTCNNVFRNNELVSVFLKNQPFNMTDEQIDTLFDSVDKAKSQQTSAFSSDFTLTEV